MSKPVDRNAGTVPQPNIAALDAIFASLNRSDAPGLTVAISMGGLVQYRRGFGLASVELGVVNTPSTRMRIGSTSKHFTCVAALLLAEEGTLDLDAPVREYMPELPVVTPEPTVRQLMNHTNGYRDYLDLSFLADGLAVKPAGQALAAQARQSNVNFRAGEKFIYNNGGYHLLSLIIERVSDMPFETFLKEKIFSPLRMWETASLPSDFEIHRGMATLHVPRPDGGYMRGIFPTQEVRGEGAMVSTVDDLLSWLAHLRGEKKIGAAALWEQLLAPTRLANGACLPYGFGLMRHDYRGVEVVHHFGGVIGGACQMLTVPSHALDIVILSNGALVNVMELAFRVVDTLLPDSLVPADTVPKAAMADFQALAGRRYASESGLLVSFADIDGTLGLSVFHLPPMPLYRDGEHLHTRFEELVAGPFAVRIDDIGSEDSPPHQLRVSESGAEEVLSLMPEKAMAPADVAPSLVGHYVAPDLQVSAEVLLDGDQLKLRWTGRANATSLVLEPLSSSKMGWTSEISDLPMRGLLSVTREGRQVTGFRIDTMRTRGLAFARQP